ncbi:MAG: hypothetical protein DRH89_09170 [Candidatus Cloacimonadota bacterium]|nr:MAG: hypothetical protein DRH89_09170 [Candidatus Cloacimonadota bacterium]
MPDLRRELDALADDFETLSDPARDESLFIYKWQPPDWYDPGWKMKTYASGREVPDCRDTDRLVELSAVLRTAASIVGSLDSARPEGMGTLIYTIPSGARGWAGRLDDDGRYYDTVADHAPSQYPVIHTLPVVHGLYLVRARMAGIVPQEGSAPVDAGETRVVALTSVDRMYNPPAADVSIRHETDDGQETD